MKKALQRGIIEVIALAAHRRRNAVSSKHKAIGFGGILNAAVRVMNQARRWSQSCTAVATNSGPLSERMCSGTPRRMNRSEITSMTRHLLDRVEDEATGLFCPGVAD